MSGSGAAKRQHQTAIRAAKMRRDGSTYRQIAEATGIDMKALAARIKLGERLLSIDASPLPGAL